MLVVYAFSLAFRDTSQYGQTSRIVELTRDWYPHTFIEFGCADGISHSNTFMLEQMGWKGFCIEPVDTIKNRKNAYQGAVCPPDQENSIVTVTVASVSGLHGIRPKLSDFGKHSIGTKQVVCYNLNTLRRKHDMDFVGYVVVDTEGTEAELLRSYSFEKWAVFLQVECNDSHACAEIKGILRRDFYLMHTVDFHNGRGGGDLLFKNKNILVKTPK